MPGTFVHEWQLQVLERVLHRVVVHRVLLESLEVVAVHRELLLVVLVVVVRV